MRRETERKQEVMERQETIKDGEEDGEGRKGRKEQGGEGGGEESLFQHQTTS